MGACQDALKLERALIAAYGPNFRRKVIRSALGSFRLADAFEECGLADPRQHPGSMGLGPAPGAVGLAQMAPMPSVPAPPGEHLRAMAGYVGGRFSSWQEELERATERWRRFALGWSRWPLSPAPRSPHGDPLL